MNQIIIFLIMHLYALFSFFKDEIKRFTIVFRKFKIKRVSKTEKIEKFKKFDVKKTMQMFFANFVKFNVLKTLK